MFSVLSLGFPVLAVLASVSPATCTPIVERGLEIRTTSLPLPVNVLHTFEFPSWCENFAIRETGELLVSRLDSPKVQQLSPTNAYGPVTVFAWDPTEYKGALGISETVSDVFYVALSAFFDGSYVKQSGVNSIFKIDMRTFVLTDGIVTSNATVTKLVDLNEADFINGLTTLDKSHILVGDIYNGWVYKVNTLTGAYSIAINDPKMKIVPGVSPNLGVNGLKIRNGYLYWTNTVIGSLNKIKISSAGLPIGTSSVVTSNVPKADDFVIKDDGTIFIAQNQMDELSVLQKGSSVADVAAGSNTSTILAGVTAGHFGRSSWDCDRLYLTTSGGLALPINGTVTVAGTISYIDTKGF